MEAMEIYFQIGRKLKELREEYGLKQSQVAEKIGLTRSSIANIEQGRQKIQIDTLYELAYLYKVTVVDLLPELSNLAKFKDQESLKVLEDDKAKIYSIINKLGMRD